MNDHELMARIEGLPARLRANAANGRGHAELQSALGRAIVRRELGLASDAEVDHARAALAAATQTEAELKYALAAIPQLKQQVSERLRSENDLARSEARHKQRDAYEKARDNLLVLRVENDRAQLIIAAREVRELATKAQRLSRFLEFCEKHQIPIN